MSAREAILARLRHALPRDAAAQEEAVRTVTARLARHAANLIPARGQLDREGRVRLFAEMASAVMADVLRLPDMAAVPAAVSTYLRERNLPQKLVLAPEPLLDQARWESQPLLRVRRGAPIARMRSA